MKFLLTALAYIVALTAATAQTPDNNAYAITSESKGAFEWTEVKIIDLNNGDVVSNVFENSKSEYNLYDGRSSKQITLAADADSTEAGNKKPFSGLSAACAYDKKSNRLYYTPLFMNQLRYIDLNNKIPSVYIFEDQKFSDASDMNVEANQMTRMVIGSDGNGYALNNDGSHLVRFTTGETPVVTDLGGLYDSPSNGDMSIKDANTSWGGDMVADASGNLYVITAHNHIFKIDITTRIALYISQIKGLPAGFTTNGAVVDKDGGLVLSSANYLTSYYKADVATWQATAIVSNQDVFNTSDLANNNLLFQTKLSTPQLPSVTEKISLYPNPVKTNAFKVSFEDKASGKYNVQLIDIAGRIISDNIVMVGGAGQVSEIKVNPALTRGMYTVKVLNHENKEVFLKKIILQ